MGLNPLSTHRFLLSSLSPLKKTASFSHPCGCAVCALGQQLGRLGAPERFFWWLLFCCELSLGPCPQEQWGNPQKGSNIGPCAKWRSALSCPEANEVKGLRRWS